jgi:purine-binding chemotaxis protein CheW
MKSSAVTTVAAGADSRRSRWVTFSLEGETYGVNVMQVQEVLKLTEVAAVPGAPDYVLGIINLRGNVVTVVDTRRLFDLPPRADDDATRIVILEVERQVVGILVDSVAEVVELDTSLVETAPTVGSEDGSRYIQGVYSRDERLIILVDLSRLLGDDRAIEEASARLTAGGGA